MSGFTKEIIAKTFTEILDEKPMSKVTVRDIVERCGVNRNKGNGTKSRKHLRKKTLFWNVWRKWRLWSEITVS